MNTATEPIINGTAYHWHCNSDEHIRSQMKSCIVQLLINGPRSTEDNSWLSKVPTMAKSLESELYDQAKTREEYLDESTLKKRLKNLVLVKAKRIIDHDDEENTKKRIKIEETAYEEKECVICMNNPSSVKFLPCRHFCLCSDCFKQLNRSKSKCPLCRCDVVATSEDNKNEELSAEHRQSVLKQQHQRLLLLRHASRCPHDDDSLCPVTPHCRSMKTLWKHILVCKDQHCRTAHCVSSRYVLSHYSKCKELECLVCTPVRDAIKRSSENLYGTILPNVQTSSSNTTTSLADL